MQCRDPFMGHCLPRALPFGMPSDAAASACIDAIRVGMQGPLSRRQAAPAAARYVLPRWRMLYASVTVARHLSCRVPGLDALLLTERSGDDVPPGLCAAVHKLMGAKVVPQVCVCARERPCVHPFVCMSALPCALTCACVCACVCVRARVRSRVCVRVWSWRTTHASVRTRTCAFVWACVRMSACVSFFCARVYGCVCACTRACVRGARARAEHVAVAQCASLVALKLGCLSFLNALLTAEEVRRANKWLPRA